VSRTQICSLIFLLAGITACTKSRVNIISDIEVVDRVGLFQSKIWKTPKSDAQACVRESVKQLSGFQLKESPSTKRQWQLTLDFEDAAEGPARSSKEGQIPHDHVFRQVGVGVRLMNLATDKLKNVRFEYSIRLIHAKNYPILTNPKVAIEEAVKASMVLLDFDISLTRKSDESLLRLLDSSKIERRSHVISEIRRRKLSNAVDSLITLLGQEDLDQETELETIGALIAIRDPRAVVPLINSAQRRREVYLTQIIFGVAEIGGKQAEAYLFTVKAGHPKASIRKHAEDALNELNRRKGKKR
jgi:hypothetical protein